MKHDDLKAMLGLAADVDAEPISELAEEAAERGDADELRRLADGGNQDAADILAEMAEEADGV